MRDARNAGASPVAGRVARVLSLFIMALAAPCLHAAGARLLHSDAGVVRLAPRVDAISADPLQLQIQTGAGLHILQLRRHDALGAIGAGGPGRAEAFQGVVAGQPGSWAAVTRIGNRWSGIWFDGRDFYGTESAGALAGAEQKTLAGAADAPVVFRLSDVVWDDHSFEGDLRHAPPGNGQQLALDLAQPAVAAGEEGPTHRLKVALVADSLLAARDGDDLENNMLARLNVVDALFSNQLGVEVTTDSVTLFTSSGTDPFTGTEEATDLLEELSAWRAGNAWQRQTALTHLFTGRDFARRTVGLAYLDTLCSRRYSASLSEARGPATFAALIAAHEIAHVFGAPHDGDAEGACATTTGNYLMAPRINGSQQFSACSLAQMAPRVEAAACLQKLATGTVPQPSISPVTQGNGGGGAVAGSALALLGLMALGRARRRRLQIRANHSAR